MPEPALVQIGQWSLHRHHVDPDTWWVNAERRGIVACVEWSVRGPHSRHGVAIRCDLTRRVDGDDTSPEGWIASARTLTSRRWVHSSRVPQPTDTLAAAGAVATLMEWAVSRQYGVSWVQASWADALVLDRMAVPAQTAEMAVQRVLTPDLRRQPIDEEPSASVHARWREAREHGCRLDAQQRDCCHCEAPEAECCEQMIEGAARWLRVEPWQVVEGVLGRSWR